MSCRVCNSPLSQASSNTDPQLCPHCAPATPLLDPDPSARLAALQLATPDQRRFVLLAMFRAGHLFESHAVAETSLAQQLIAWLLEHGSSLAFMRWLAEDSVHGLLVWPSAIHNEPQRARTRLPAWFAHATDIARRVDQATLSRSSIAQRSKARALAERLAQLPQAHLQTIASALPDAMRRAFERGLAKGDRKKTGNIWTPDPDTVTRLQSVRRWPIPVDAIENEHLLCCTICGETVSPNAPCAWCHTHPDSEPPTLLNFADILAARELCPRCAIDYTAQAAPIQCPCCHLNLAT